jgi:PAS domain S-box-containing protein
MGVVDPAKLRFDLSHDLLCMSDASGHFTSLNRAWEEILGWSRQELMARPFIEFVHPDDRERTLAEAVRIAEQDRELVAFENRYRTKDGDWRWLHWNARTDGETWFAVAFDVTEAKQAEQRLRQAIAEDRLLAYSQAGWRCEASSSPRPGATWR